MRHNMARRIFVLLSVFSLALIGGLSLLWPSVLGALVVVVPIVLIGLWDMLQTRHTIRRNFPVVGNVRYLLESIRPEIQQYFIELNTNGRPFSREQRSVVYQRAKSQLDTVPFGTQHDVYALGYEWMGHSLAPVKAPHDPPRITIGGPDCQHPYSASLLNISAMSFGSLSDAAIRALSGGAKDGGFFHNTGEGGVSPYHLEPGGDLVWQIGTGYFGCRNASGGFDPAAFAETAKKPNVKMIEIKLSQGAKPGHGGILPAAKVTPEIARIRLVPLGQDVLSPPAHAEFSTPIGLLDFVAKLRELSGGKPVGFKFCVGRRVDVFALCKAMVETGITPDFITVDGGEGGTGAAPLEFSNALGSPLYDALCLVHNALIGVGLRERIKIIASGGVIDGKDIAVRLALGADLCSSARGMMFALGCIQALRCNNNSCPTGVATQDRSLIKGLVVADKRQRVANYQRNTVRHMLEMMAAMGCTHPDQLNRGMIHRRIGSTAVARLDELYPLIETGCLARGDIPENYRKDWHAARAESFAGVLT